MINKKKKTLPPPETLQDRTTFAFNNLNQLNLQQKCDEIREILTDDYWPWLAQYLVIKRVSIEINFHVLYSNFLDCLGKPEVSRMVTRETYESIKVLLQNDERIVNFSDRSLLKNLGHWLGILTLRKNKPILQNDIDMKGLLIEAYYKGQQELLYVVPFVAKVLESCAKSRIFRPPNPWTMAIMNVLAELHQEQDLKLTLKFEIEVLCKNLNIDVAELKPAVYLKDPKKLRNVEYQLSHSNKKSKTANNQQQQSAQEPIQELVETKTHKTVVPQPMEPVHTVPSLPTNLPESSYNYTDISVAGFADIAQHITVDNQLPLFQTHPCLKRLVTPAVERAIQECIHPIVDKSMKIALTASEQIVCKDFALDPDENRMRTAARQMVHNLTAGMAMVTCKNQISALMSSNLKQVFLTAIMGSTQQQKDLAEQAANVVAANNTKLACAFIQKTAIEKATSEMDKRLLNEIKLREIARQEGRRYFDPVVKYQAERIPEKIRLKIGGVTPQQMAVYGEFEKNIPGFLLLDRTPTAPADHIQPRIVQEQARDFDDSPTLIEKTEYLLREWVTIYHSPYYTRNSTKAFEMFVQQMNIYGIFRTDDSLMKFFKLSTRMCVDYCYRTLAESNGALTVIRTKCFSILDAFVQLVALFVKHSGNMTNISTKINLLNKVLEIVAGVLLEDHELRGLNFQQLPYHRIFIMLLLELCVPEPFLEAINYQVLMASCHIFHIIRPTKAPGFCYAWLELISHRVFIGKMLATTHQQKCQEMYARLLIDLFKYLAPYLHNAVMAKPVLVLYKGTLRVLLMLYHDFPEVLSDYYYEFCDVIPLNCIQMRNLILSAFPKNIRLPDPYTSNLKADTLPEIVHALGVIRPLNFKEELDSYLKIRAPATFLSELRSSLQVSQEAEIQRYNIQLMNALVLYVGTQAINFIRNKGNTLSMTTIAHSAHMDIFQNLAVDLDTEGRYLFLNAIINQLRYPNIHTQYFSCTLLYLFAEANSEVIQEQITRVLLERLVVNRPHPWGLLVTFIELIKNPSYKFLSHEFVHCAPEIRKLFESVTKPCMIQKELQPTPNSETLEC